MGIEHIDNFNIYGNNLALLTQGIYAAADGVLGLDPDGGGNYTLISGGLNNTRNDYARYALSTGSTDTVGMGFRTWYDSLPSANTVISGGGLFTTGNDRRAYYGFLSNGDLEVGIWDGAAYQVFTAGVPVLTANAWWHVEAKFEFDTGAGTCDFEIRIEGRTIIQETGVDATTDGIGQVCLGDYKTSALPSSPTVRYKDFVIWNGLTAFNTDFLGSVLVLSLLPTADVALNWTPVGGAAGFSILDNTPPNDAQYIQAAAPPGTPAAYVGELTNLPLNTTSVRALMSCVRAAKSDGGDGSLQVGVKSGASTGLGTDRPITITQTYWRDVFQVDPATAAPWGVAAVNAAQIQINRTL